MSVTRSIRRQFQGAFNQRGSVAGSAYDGTVGREPLGDCIHHLRNIVGNDDAYLFSVVFHKLLGRFVPKSGRAYNPGNIRDDARVISPPDDTQAPALCVLSPRLQLRRWL